MSVVHSYGKEKVSIDGEKFLVIETKGEEGYEWKEVTFKTKQEEIYIGGYYTYNYSSSRQWMEYNSDFIVLMAIYTCGYDVSDPQVMNMFDIKSKKIVEGEQSQLIELYNKEFKGISRKKKI